MCHLNQGKVELTQEEVLNMTNNAAALYANKCVHGLDFCMKLTDVELNMALDPVSRVDVVPFMSVGVNFPKLALLSDFRKNIIIQIFTSVIPGLNAFEVSLQKLPLAASTASDRRLSSEATTAPAFAYKIGVNLQRFQICANMSCSLMSNMSSCSCGQVDSECILLLDDVCDEDLNCYDFLFDAGSCDVQDCNGRNTEKQSIQRFLGILAPRYCAC